jgi:hypothetical protein
LFVIKEFYWLVCRARSINPEDRSECLGWTETTGRTDLTGSGVYRYQARWSDGKATQGSFRITDKMIDDIDSHHRSDTITIPVNR